MQELPHTMMCFPFSYLISVSIGAGPIKYMILRLAKVCPTKQLKVSPAQNWDNLPVSYSNAVVELQLSYSHLLTFCWKKCTCCPHHLEMTINLHIVRDWRLDSVEHYNTCKYACCEFAYVVAHVSRFDHFEWMKAHFKSWADQPFKARITNISSMFLLMFALCSAITHMVICFHCSVSAVLHVMFCLLGSHLFLLSLSMFCRTFSYTTHALFNSWCAHSW